jgi:hypothetical protein
MISHLFSDNNFIIQFEPKILFIRATIISASIPKYVDGIRWCTTQAFPGATIGRITELLSRGKINISNIDIVIIHVGTTNISSAQNVDTIISYYGDLIHKLRYKTNAHIVCTSILATHLMEHIKKNQDDYLIKNYDINLYTVSFF